MCIPSLQCVDGKSHIIKIITDNNSTVTIFNNGRNPILIQPYKVALRKEATDSERNKYVTGSLSSEIMSKNGYGSWETRVRHQ